MANRLGTWRWYAGMDDEDGEMCECPNREAAIAHGVREKLGNPFYIVEARMLVKDENAMGRGERDTAPFAESRNDEWVDNPGLALVTSEDTHHAN